MPLTAPPSGSRIAAADIAQNTLRNRAMIVELHLSMWGGKRLDREATRRMIRHAGAADDAGNFVKHLVPKEALDPVQSAHRAARDRHNDLTLPWGEGSRILAATGWFAYTQAMAEERAKVEKIHRKFCTEDYPELLLSAPERLTGGMYKPADYPSPAAIANRFGFKLVVMPLPHHDDFRLNLGADVETAIRSEIEATIISRQADAQRDLWTRLLATVQHFASTMAEEGKRFQKTTVTNLTEIANLAPKLALHPDPVLEEICAEIRAITERCDAESLRASKMVRARAAEEAHAALRRIESALEGAF
ncbi:MAG TPA: hypothetical protein VFS20_18195 [Longimicrobium sp.]|nr:hypothetical protein [Longimicrobium sp.]